MVGVLIFLAAVRSSWIVDCSVLRCLSSAGVVDAFAEQGCLWVMKERWALRTIQPEEECPPDLHVGVWLD